ncbi:MAG: BMP family ABC transporter substrate-binding protein [Acidimicrobiia bacterium]|nr:BMP family ABC transporter substrate-binding protein [Acidimicrobiia bacterium]
MIRTTRWMMVVAAGLAFILPACGRLGFGSESQDAVSEEGAGDGIRVAVVAPGAENDLSSTQSIIGGLDAVDGVAELTVISGIARPEDAATAARTYADDGYDLIMVHSSEYGDFLPEIAADFPEIAFAWGPAADTFGLDNVSSYTAASDEGGYVLGALAATMCSRIGVVGPTEVAEAKRYVDGFKLGAEAGGAEVDVIYAGTFDDVDIAADAAVVLALNGADCLTGTARMTVGAIGVAAREGLLWFGTQSDQTPAAADGVVVASQIYEWEVVLQDLVDDVARGRLGGNIYGIDLENGGLVVEFGNVETTAEMTRLVADVSAKVIARQVATTIDG